MSEMVRGDPVAESCTSLPSDQVWLDVVVPRDDPLWDDDVVEAGMVAG